MSPIPTAPDSPSRKANVRYGCLRANDFDGIEMGRRFKVDGETFVVVRVRGRVGRAEECRYRALAAIDWTLGPAVADLPALALALGPASRRKLNRGGIAIILIGVERLYTRSNPLDLYT